MAQLNQMEVQSIRECVGSHRTIAAKLNDYSEKCTDSQVKQMFSKAAQDAANSANQLLQLL
jgi:hypothetical protein